MTKPSVRQNILIRSVATLLDDGEQVRHVVVMFTRHRWFLPYSVLAGLGVFAVASATGIAGFGNRIVIGVCGMAIAGMATTNYWVLAETATDLVLCRSSRVRQYAKSIKIRLPTSTPLEMVGSTVVTSDWRIDGIMYTLTKRWEATMRQLSMQD